MNIEQDDAQQLLAVALDAALEAAALIRSAFGSECPWTPKSSALDIVTPVDVAADQIISKRLLARYPDSVILSEEGPHLVSTEGKLRWIVDPLDGTLNFVRQIPFVAVSIAADVDGVTRCGVVVDALRAEGFVCGTDRAMTLDGKTLQVSHVNRPDRALIGAGLPTDSSGRSASLTSRIADTVPAGFTVARFGSAALSLGYVAAGRLDGYIDVSPYVWDVAAGCYLVTHAGGRVFQKDGILVASNSAVHEPLVQAVLSEVMRQHKKRPQLCG